MKRLSAVLILTLTMPLLFACGDSGSDETRPAESEPVTRPWDDELEVRDRARQTEQDLLDAAQRQRRTIEEQEG